MDWNKLTEDSVQMRATGIMVTRIRATERLGYFNELTNYQFSINALYSMLYYGTLQKSVLLFS